MHALRRVGSLPLKVIGLTQSGKSQTGAAGILVHCCLSLGNATSISHCAEHINLEFNFESSNIPLSMEEQGATTRAENID